LISPWSSYGTGVLTTSISNFIQDKLIKNSELGNQLLSEKDDPNEDKLTYASIINHEAK
jgi:hypothetical protein